MGLCRVTGVRQLRNRSRRLKLRVENGYCVGNVGFRLPAGKGVLSRSLEVREVWALRLWIVIESLLGREPGRVNRGWLGRKVKVF